MRLFLFRAALAPISLAFVPLPRAHAQATIVVAVGTSPILQAVPRAHIAVPLVIDVSNARGANVAAITTSASWDHTRFSFDSLIAGPFGQMSANTSKAASGTVAISAFSVAGSTQTVTLATLYLTTTSLTGGTSVDVKPSVAGNAVGTPILSMIKSRSLAVCVQEGSAKCPPGNKK